MPQRVEAPLAPAPFPMGIFPEYTRHTTQIALKVRERKMSFTGDDFSIKDAVTGAMVFDIQAKAFSFRGSKVVVDTQNRKLFMIEKAPFSLPSRYQGVDVANPKKVLFEVSGASFFGTRLEIKFNNTAADGRPMTFKLDGDWASRDAVITNSDGMLVARISRQFMNAGELIFGQQTYIVTIAAGVDAALIMAICICLDEKASDR
ncbi:hypothetical protein BCV70DRAFT_214489 [Testicularia cyperi]|uniref:DUF567-domain-containing protein n=1 Tax=Testicularia cyperi TaxID=1882483 RepID=A0A317XY14_9BASI|nr:hypothetical protein BCV70DRAFT_214489 [Testicularia cyperi]